MSSSTASSCCNSQLQPVLTSFVGKEEQNVSPAAKVCQERPLKSCSAAEDNIFELVRSRKPMLVTSTTSSQYCSKMLVQENFLVHLLRVSQHIRQVQRIALHRLLYVVSQSQTNSQNQCILSFGWATPKLLGSAQLFILIKFYF